MQQVAHCDLEEKLLLKRITYHRKLEQNWETEIQATKDEDTSI